MGQDANEIRREIEVTRSRMSETVGEIGYKADVPNRVRDNVNERIESVKETIGGAIGGAKDTIAGAVGSAKQTIAGTASDASGAASERLGSASETTRQAVSMATENPLGLALGALAVGFLGGLMLPVSDMERERIGPVRDQIAQRAQSAASEVVQAGKTVFQETLETATSSAQQHGREVMQHAVAGTPLEGQQQGQSTS